MWWTRLAHFKFPKIARNRLWRAVVWACMNKGLPLRGRNIKTTKIFTRLLPVDCCACLAHPWGVVIRNYKGLAVLNHKAEREVS